jgi:hypothetical protein
MAFGDRQDGENYITSSTIQKSANFIPKAGYRKNEKG